MSTSNARAEDRIGQAIFLTLSTVVIFGIQDAVSKMLVQDYSPFQIAMMRFWAFAGFALWLVARRAPLSQALRSRAVGWQVARGVLLTADIWCFALALRTMPLGELQAITLVYPLLITLFAIPMLGERVGPFRIGAVIVGFLGAMVIVRPGGLPLDWGVLYTVLSATFYALYVVITRKVGMLDSASTSMVYVGVVGLVLTSAVGVFFWTPMAWGDLGLVAVIVVTSIAGHGLTMLALTKAPASVLQPFNYFSLPWAITLGYLVFGQMVDPVSLIGAGVIVMAGLAVMARERARSRRG